MRRFPLLLGLVSALIVIPVGAAREPAETPPRKSGDVVLQPVSVTVAGIGKVAFELGTLYVPENRAESTSRLIGVGFARFQAETKSDAPPIFMLPGGPGHSFLSSLKPGIPRRASSSRSSVTGPSATSCLSISGASASAATC